MCGTSQRNAKSAHSRFFATAAATAVTVKDGRPIHDRITFNKGLPMYREARVICNQNRNIDNSAQIDKFAEVYTLVTDRGFAM